MLLGGDDMNIKKYIRVWLKLTACAFSVDLSNRVIAIFALTGKILRFLFFLGFLVLLISKTKTLLGYNLYQVVFFFLTFNLVDILTQLFFRGAYHFRGLIIYGKLDLILVKPINTLFASLGSHTDVYDLITLIALLGYMIYFLVKGYIEITVAGILLYLAFLICSFLIALAFHIFALGVGVLTTEIDHLIWIYRDLSGMARVPVDIYREPLRTFLTFVVPVGIMMTFPAKALMGLLSWQWVVFSFLISGVFLWASLRFWKYALTQYSSASS